MMLPHLLSIAAFYISLQKQSIWADQNVAILNSKNEKDFSSLKDVYCYSLDTNPYSNFTTKTNYELTHGNLADVIEPEECKPAQIWTLNRHGTRYAKVSQNEAMSKLDETLNSIRNNFKEGRGSLCQDDYDLLDSWEWNSNITNEYAEELTPQGFVDLAGIARRFKNKYPSLLNVPYTNDNFYFQYSVSSRVHDSFKGYIYGLFGSNSSGINGIESDEVIKEMENCTAWIEAESEQEAAMFHNTDLYQKMKTTVSKRLGFEDDIQDSTLDAIYQACSFEKAWYPEEPSKWCVAFAENDLQILEYETNLKNYYSDGYGNTYSERAGCPLLKDLFTRLGNTISGVNKGPQVVALFSHSGPFLMFMSSLGILKDGVHPTSGNYMLQSDKSWNSSFLSPFATNFAAVLYECYDAIYKVQFLLNERPVQIDDNCSRGLCSWNVFKQKFAVVANSCSLEFCDSKM